MSQDLKDRENFINQAFQQKDLELTKLAKENGLSASELDQARQKLRDMMHSAKQKASIDFGDSLDKLNAGQSLSLAGGTVSPNLKNMAKTSALKQLGKKIAGIIPFAGAAYGALSGDPAMAAEEAVGDIPVFGQSYEAIKPKSAGESPEVENQMLREHSARKRYEKSPARLNKLKALIGRSPAIDSTEQPKSELRTNSPLQPGRIPSADAEMSPVENIPNEMSEEIQGKMKEAEDMPQDVYRAKKLKALMGLKG